MGGRERERKRKREREREIKEREKKKKEKERRERARAQADRAGKADSANTAGNLRAKQCFLPKSALICMQTST